MDTSIKAPYHYYFDNTNKHADWKERLGYALLKPMHHTQGYVKVTEAVDLNCQEIAAKTSRVVLLIFRLCNFIGVTRLGKACLKASTSHKAEYAKIKAIMAECDPFEHLNPKVKDPSSPATPPITPLAEDEEPMDPILKEELKRKAQDIFYKTANEWSYLEGVLDQYEGLINSKNPHWTGKKASTFFYGELLSIHSNMQKLIKDVEQLIKLYGKEEISPKEGSSDKNQLLCLVKNTKKLKNKYKTLISTLKPRLSDEKVIGLGNAGNTCYINSSLQPLLAIKNFQNLVPDHITQNSHEDNDAFYGRQQILSELKAVVEAWQAKCPAAELGRLIGKMRTTIFDVGLFEGGFMDKESEHSFQDAGSFFELILHVIGRGFTLDTVRSFKLPNGGVKKAGDGPVPQTVLQLKSNSGSVQDKINAFSTLTEEELDPQYALKHVDTGSQEVLKLTKFEEQSKIIGDPQELLIFRVEEHVVDPVADSVINCASLFANAQTGLEAEYELVGFAQNHSQVHWTSVVREDGVWKYCNDSHVSVVDTSDHSFTFPANYIVYKKKNSKILNKI